MASYDPNSYHCGSVWPHDTALAVAGLVRYGFRSEAHRLILGLLDAAVHSDGRLPELMSGLTRDDVPAPVSYPTSCSPQAWAAAAPLQLVRSLLRLDPRLPQGEIRIDPDLPSQIGSLRLERTLIGHGRVSVAIRDGRVDVDGVPSDVRLVRPSGAAVTASWTSR